MTRLLAILDVLEEKKHVCVSGGEARAVKRAEVAISMCFLATWRQIPKEVAKRSVSDYLCEAACMSVST